MALNRSGCARICFPSTSIRNRGAALLLIVALLSFSHAVDADSPLASRTIIVAFDEAYPPHEFLKDGKPAGFNIDVLRACAQETGLKIEFRPMAWADVIPSIVRGEVDAACMVAEPKRREKLDFTTETVLNPALGIFVRCNIKGIFTFHDLNGRTVAVQRGDAAEWVLPQYAPRALIIETPSQVRALRLVTRGDVAAALVNITAAQYYMKQHPRDCLRWIDMPVPLPPRVIGVRKGDRELLTVLDLALKRIKENGRYRAICRRWFGARTFMLSLSGIDIAKLIATWITAGGLLVYLLRRRWRGLHWFYAAAGFGIMGCTFAVITKATLSETALLVQHASFTFASFATLLGVRVFFRKNEPIGGMKQ